MAEEFAAANQAVSPSDGRTAIKTPPQIGG